jgi:dihydrofolate synthase/folylpolyglutamate synthase
VTIPREGNALPASDLAQVARQLEIKTHTADSVSAALQNLTTESFATGRILICGSLYMAGIVLAENG